MNYILLHKSYGPVSMQMTQDHMEQQVSLVAKRTNGSWQIREKNGEWESLHSIMSIVQNPNNKIINWGNSIFSNDNYFILNRPSAVKRASNKKIGRQVLQNAGIAVPFTVFPTANVAESFAGLTFPVIARPSHHHGGNNFHVLENVTQLTALLWGKNADDWYVSNIFEKTTELRVHVAHGKVLFIQEKPLVEGELRANQAVNHESWRVMKWSEYSSGFLVGVAQQAILAVAAIGLNYGAVDVMVNMNNSTCSICEINSSPSVNTEYSSSKYAAYFDWEIRHNFPATEPAAYNRFIFYSQDLRE